MEPNKSSTIHVNPKFKGAHFNPNFLKSQTKAPQIHFNPKFFGQLPLHPPMIRAPQYPPELFEPEKPFGSIQMQNSDIKNPIVKITKRSLIRAPVMVEQNTQQQQQQSSSNLIKISNTKLIKATQLMEIQQKENEVIKNAAKKDALLQSKRLNVNSESIYKLDRRKQNASKTLQKKRSNKLIIQGQKFVIDPSGMTLKRDNGKNSQEDENLNLPYLVSLEGKKFKRTISNDSYERDNSSNSSRNRVTMVRTRSKTLLQRTSSSSKLSETICPIYRRIGKCIAYAKGKCSKLHDPRYVIVCLNFVRGICKDEKCLLSHNANLHKMPVCKYYLQGKCLKSKDECLYLHKKVTDGTKICSEFLKGYCPEADKCVLLHDHIVGGDRKKYSYIKSPSMLKRKKKTVFRKPAPPPKSPVRNGRYFDFQTAPSPISEKKIPKFSKNAPELPEFIKL